MRGLYLRRASSASRIRFRDDVDAAALATQSWAIGHGLVSLVVTGPLPRQTLDNGAPMLTALYIGCGDDPDTCRRSVELGWRLR